MELVIESWWNKVVDDPTNPMGTRVLPEFVLHDSLSFPNGGGWDSRERWRTSAKHRHDFVKFDDTGAARFRGSRHYGIASYQRVYLTAETPADIVERKRAEIAQVHQNIEIFLTVIILVIKYTRI